MRITRFLGAVLAIIASAALATAQAGGSGGGGGYGGGGHGGGFHVNNSSWSGSKSYSNSNSSSSANNSITFKNSNGGANYLFGAAAIIGALNPPEGQKIIVRDGDVKVTVNFIGAGAIPSLPGLKDDREVTAPRSPRTGCTRGEEPDAHNVCRPIDD